MQVTDFDGSCQVRSADELLARLRSVRLGDDGAFVLDHGGPESLWLHVKGEAAFLWFCLDPATGRAGFGAHKGDILNSVRHVICARRL